MNNEKQILKNQTTILTALVDFKEIDLETIKSINKRVEETKEVLFPKEDVPYAESLFVKSSINEKEVKKQ